MATNNNELAHARFNFFRDLSQKERVKFYKVFGVWPGDEEGHNMPRAWEQILFASIFRKVSDHTEQEQKEIGIRLRRVCQRLGLPEYGDDQFHYGAAFAILGDVSRAIERIPNGLTQLPLSSTSDMDKAGAAALPDGCYEVDAERVWSAMVNKYLEGK